MKKNNIGRPLNNRERMRIAMSNEMPDRIPTMPQICHNHAISLFYDDFRDGILDTIKNPEKTLSLALKTAEYYDVDGLRLFLPGKRMDAFDDGKDMVVKDNNGENIGKVDVQGGGNIVLNEPILPVEKIEDLDKIPKAQADKLIKTESFCLLRKAVEKAHLSGRFAASCPPGFTINYLSERRGRGQALLDVVDNPDLVKRIMDIGLENAIEYAKALIKCGIDALYIGDPLSSASLISPAHFEKFCFPGFKVFCEELHRNDILIYLHICGNAVPLLEMMADTGVDCVEPLDPMGGVELADAKKRIGKKVALMGGLNTLTLLNGTSDLVYDEAISCCNAGGQGGGYILAAGDMVPDFTPEANVKAMVRAAKSFSYS